MTADVCLILEGTYPFVRGGVSAWTHELIQQQSHLTFHIVSLLPRDEVAEQKYPFPSNVVGHTVIHLQRLLEGKPLSTATATQLAEELEGPLSRITTGLAQLNDLHAMLAPLRQLNGALGGHALMNSEEMWALITRMYEANFAESSMLDYFWSWRAVIGGLYSLLLPPLPQAKVYHALSTGYAGLMLARAKLETQHPCIITEHGIYTNERRIEIALADWLTETASKTLTVDRTRLSLRDFWMDTFTNYSRIAYEAADRVITLFAGNQPAQVLDGADPERMQVIPNGVDLERFGVIQAEAHERPTVALIGRVVPIKDIKSFLRGVALLRERLPDVQALILGPTEEDTDYVLECQAMAQHLGLSQHVTFTGQMKVDEYLPTIDLVVFSSLSEAQPLVILEAGACGIPSVATDVGACRELIMGRDDEQPHFGPGGAVVPLGSPQALAEAMLKLLTDRNQWNLCSRAARSRVEKYYNKRDQVANYRTLYDTFMNTEY